MTADYTNAATAGAGPAAALGIPYGSRVVIDLNVTASNPARGDRSTATANPIRTAGTLTALLGFGSLTVIELDNGEELIPWHAIARIRRQPRAGAHPAL